MRYFTILFVLLTTAFLSAQEVPTKNPAEVWVKGRFVPHSWRDGRIFVPTSELSPLLNIESEHRAIDLIEALEQKGGYRYGVVNGKFEAKRDPSRYAEYNGSEKARAGNSQYNQAYAAHKRQKAAEEATKPQLTHIVQRFVADTGFVRAFIRVTNQGGGPSDSATLLAEFTDGYGKAFAQDTAAIPPLAPGEYVDIEAFSMVRDDEMAANGVIRTFNNEKVRVTFR